MAGVYNGTTNRYLGVSGTGTTPYTSTGWTLIAMFYPDSSGTINTFAYVSGHGEPLAAGVHAVNMLIHNVGGGVIRMIVDVSAGNVVDFTSSNSINADQWNSAAIVWDGTSKVKIFLNGTKSEQTVSAFGAVSPSVPVRIGFATHGGSRQFNGRICHPAKFSRALSDAEGANFTSSFFSPEFAQQNADWHAEMHRGGNLAFDLVGNATISEIQMVYGPHAPVDYPVDNESEIAAIIDSARAPSGNQFSFA